MKKYFKEFLFAVLAGVAISIGCVVYLSVSNAVAGSILFSIGLLAVLGFKLNLFTGKAPYLIKNDIKYAGFTFLVWLGNFTGTALTAFCIHFTKINGKIIEKCTTLALGKVNDGLISLFILGIFCGIMMYIAVDTFINQGTEKNFSSTVTVIFSVSVFILAGFEHSVADMFYFMLSLPIKQWIIPLLVITLGNVVGGNAFCFITKLKRD